MLKKNFLYVMLVLSNDQGKHWIIEKSRRREKCRKNIQILSLVYRIT